MSEKALILQAFPDYMHEVIGFYVYRLIDPRNNRTFYVGKGYGNRAFQHVAEAATANSQTTPKLDRIREIEASGEHVRYVIHRHALNEREAFEVEAALIDAYDGLLGDEASLTNVQPGMHHFERGAMTAEDVRALHAAQVVDLRLPTLLLNLRRQFEHGLTAKQLYERTRQLWRLNPRTHIRVKHAMPVAYGIIREVYRIERWERIDAFSWEGHEDRRSGAGIDLPSKSQWRWRFEGEPDTVLRGEYVGKSLAFELRGQNPGHWFDSESIGEIDGNRPILST